MSREWLLTSDILFAFASLGLCFTIDLDNQVSSISSVLLSVPLSLTLSNHDQSRRESLMILNRLVLKTPKQNMVKTFFLWLNDLSSDHISSSFSLCAHLFDPNTSLLVFDSVRLDHANTLPHRHGKVPRRSPNPTSENAFVHPIVGLGIAGTSFPTQSPFDLA